MYEVAAVHHETRRWILDGGVVRPVAEREDDFQPSGGRRASRGRARGPLDSTRFEKVFVAGSKSITARERPCPLS